MRRQSATTTLVLVLMTGLSQSVCSDAIGKPATPGPLGQDYLIQLAGGLAVVLLSILALAWILKKLNRLPNKGQSALEIVATLSVGQRERLVVVRSGNLELLLGVAPGSIAKLHVLSDNGVNYSASHRTGDLKSAHFSAFMPETSVSESK
ncbi:MAG: flagellar biosynthetic protein FliO [Porticoccaceae bacterium]|nr:flagellar biosynthetic protein FliO [Porticoccaceae bacterium]